MGALSSQPETRDQSAIWPTAAPGQTSYYLITRLASTQPGSALVHVASIDYCILTLVWRHLRCPVLRTPRSIRPDTQTCMCHFARCRLHTSSTRPGASQRPECRVCVSRLAESPAARRVLMPSGPSWLDSLTLGILRYYRIILFCQAVSTPDMHRLIDAEHDQNTSGKIILSLLSGRAAPASPLDVFAVIGKTPGGCGHFRPCSASLDLVRE